MTTPKKSFFDFRLKGSFFSVLGLILLLLVGLSGLFTAAIVDSLNKWESEKTTAIATYIDSEVKQETSRVVLAALTLANDESLQKLFSERDRPKLLQASERIWKKIQPYSLAQFQYNVPSAAGTVTFLRVHHPEEYGEVNAAYRPTVVKCNLERELVQGLEQGKSGYGFRAVVPMFYGEKYLGCVETGSAFGSEFLAKLDRNFPGTWSIVNLSRGVNTLGGDKVVVASHNQTDEQSLNQSLLAPESTLKKIKEGVADYHMDSKSETISLYVPVRSFSGDIVIYLRHNYHTDYFQKFHSMIYQSLAICLLGLTLSSLLIVLLYRQITIPIKGLVQEAEKIKNFQLDEKVTVTARLTELQDLIVSITNMKTGLISFKKYVPAQLVRQLIETNQVAVVSGQRREVTVLFSDIADFTAISESMKPRELTEQLSAYLNAVTEIIMEHGGTVDKYIGDAVMAFWNAPVEVKHHATEACIAALEVQKRIDELNQQWQAAGRPAFHTRIGINSGETVVGNMGSEQRLNYTVIGDAVNLASRLEGINKTYKTSIIVSESTYKAAQDAVEARILDFTQVKGKTQLVTLYELVAEKGDISSLDLEFIHQFAEGVSLYRERRWDAAIKLFSQLSLKRQGDYPTQIFLERCRQFKATPPPEDWEGLVSPDRDQAA